MKRDDYPFLPSDRYIAHVLGLTDLEYYYFKKEARKRAQEQPAPVATAGLEVFIIIALVIQVGLTIVASFFKPKPGRPAQLKSRNQGGDAINSVERYSPRVGFDSTQEIAQIGQTIPLVYAKRETIGGVTYGGVRIATPLIWSHMQSFGGSQLLQCLFLIGEGTISSIDTTNFAIGSNALGGYLFSGSALSDARISVYFSKDGGRITSTDHILGRPPSTDPGAQGLSDIFALPSGADFSHASKPTNQTVFGLYTPIGNNLGFKVNPQVRPAVNAQLVPKGDDGDARVKCDRDVIALSLREKYKAYFSTRSGLISGSVGSVGSTTTYKLFKSSDAETDFSVNSALSGWGISKELRRNPWGSDFGSFNFRFGYSGTFISNSSLLNLLSVSITDVDLPKQEVTITASFNSSSAGSLLNNIRDGQYQIPYRLVLTNASPEGTQDDIRIEINLEVNVRQDRTTDYSVNTQASYTDPTYSFNSDTGTITKVSSGSVTVTGDINSSTNYNLTFAPVQFTITAEFNDSGFHEELSGDVASAVSSRQKSWDDAILVGELYKIGSALAVCTGRTDDVFQSEADFSPTGGGKEVTATFKTVRAGTATTYSSSVLEASGKTSTDRRTATNGPHIFRVAIANISTSRECQLVELGIKSVLGSRLGGICNFKDTLTFAETDGKACRNKEGRTISRGDTLKVDQYSSGNITSAVERYSFFKVSYREAGTSNAFTTLSPCFGIRGITQQNSFNALSFTMPSKKRWELRLEPLSGWEIRSNTASGTLYIIDSKLETKCTVTSGSVTTVFKGREIARSKEEFTIGVSRRGSIGINHPDEDNYIDAWGKLAETFIYEEVSTTTTSPEHEIVYVNEIVENPSTPIYDNLAVLGLNVRSSFEWQQFTQFSCYVTGGLGNTHLFPEILKDILTNTRYGLGHTITEAQIDTTSFTSAATWCQSRRYFFDGVLTEKQNLRQWAADVAATMLLIFGESNGKFFLKPAVSFSAITINGLFTAGNILENSFSLQYLETEERLPIQVSIKYREERSSTSLQNPGLFPVEREILIREAITDETETIEAIDISDYCTSREHAIDVAKYIIRMRRVPTHAIKFQTTYEGIVASLQPGDYIKFALDTTYYDEFNNGAVTGEGALVATKPLADGTYDVIAWNGTANNPPTDQILTVSNGGTTATPTGVVFSVKNSVTQVRTYQIESISPEENGAFTLEAVHMPTNSSGILELVSDWDSATAWVIQE